MRARPTIALLTLLCAVGACLPACGDRDTQDAGSDARRPLLIAIAGEGTWTIHQSELDAFALVDGDYDLMELLKARGITRFAMAQAGNRRILADRARQYRLVRDGAGFALVGGDPPERISFDTLHLIDTNVTRPPQQGTPPPKEVPLVVGDRTMLISRKSLADVRRLPAGGRAVTVAFGDLLAHLGLEVDSGHWAVTDAAGRTRDLAWTGAQPDALAIQVNRRGHVHVAIGPWTRGKPASRIRSMRRIEWVPSRR